LPFLFSHAAAVFDSEPAVRKAIQAISNDEHYGKPVPPREVWFVLEKIRGDLKDKNIEFLVPSPEETHGTWGLAS